MDSIQHSFDHFGLHCAASAGDDDGVSDALTLGADVNALDTAGRTAIMCAVAGEHWQNVDASDASFMTPRRLNTIRILVRHPNISLLTLNAPQSSMNGVVPLGMAAWLNMPESVRLLLEESCDRVAVDGMDTHGATALMYAARDGGLDVVQLLLSHSARPDFRDCNHRTSVQFALSHPQILWLCESILRRHRWRESQSADRNKLSIGFEDILELTTSSLPSDSLEPPPLSIFTNQATSRLTDTLISSIVSSDLSFLHSLLFAPALPPSSPAALYPMSAPVLVNRLDSNGWGPIHHCASVKYPCIEVLDALYCAGAEISLFTANEHFTPLHVLAQSPNLSVEDSDCALSLYHFTVHLIRDLRAPLAARDKNDETCIHVAAEHGSCINLLMVLLDCDTTGGVRELRNARGLTALEVAKPEFRIAFGEDAEKLRSVSSLSTRTIRQNDSFASLVSFSEWKLTTLDDTASLYSPQDYDIEGSTQQLLANLRFTSPSIQHRSEPGHIDHLNTLIVEASHLNQNILNHFRSKVQEATKELQDLRNNSDKTRILLDLVVAAASEKLGGRGFLWSLGHRTRDSEDSQYTAVSSSGSPSRNGSASQIAKPDTIDDDHVSVATQTVPLSPSNSSPTHSRPTTWVYWPESSTLPTESSTYKAHLANLADVEQELTYLERNKTGSPTLETRIKNLAKKKKKIEDKLKDLEPERKAEKRDAASHGTAKLKAWLKRIITHDKPARLEIVKEVDEQNCAVGREVKSWTISSVHYLNSFDAHIDYALRTSNAVLNASRKDLSTIEQYLNSADQFINLANHSISRAERVVKRALKKRETMIADLRFSNSAVSSDSTNSIGLGTPGALGYSLTLKSSATSLSSIYSSHSSCASIAPTLMENDDDDTRAIRRLLLRKIEAGIVGSWDEMDKVMGWLRIVKEAIRSVKRRAYL